MQFHRCTSSSPSSPMRRSSTDGCALNRVSFATRNRGISEPTQSSADQDSRVSTNGLTRASSACTPGEWRRSRSTEDIPEEVFVPFRASATRKFQMSLRRSLSNSSRNSGRELDVSRTDLQKKELDEALDQFFNAELEPREGAKKVSGRISRQSSDQSNLRSKLGFYASKLQASI